MKLYYEAPKIAIEVSMWVYDAREEYLFHLDSNTRFNAVSGPYGKGVLPNGQYALHAAVKLLAVPANKPYTAPDGTAWWAGLQPSLDIDRTGLGIHPDGNVPGTLGCVGVTSDYEKCFELLQEPGVLMVVS